MKKVLFFSLFACVALLTSCKKEQVPPTNAALLAGNWKAKSFVVDGQNEVFTSAENSTELRFNFRENGTCAFTYTLNESIDGQIQSGSETYDGSYTLSENDLQISINQGGETSTMRVTISRIDEQVLQFYGTTLPAEEAQSVNAVLERE